MYNCIVKAEGTFNALNKMIKGIDCRVIAEVDTLIEQVNHRGQETKELDKVTKDLLLRFSVMEEHIRVLEEEGTVKTAMIHLLFLEVDGLKERICHCEEDGPRPVSGSGTCDDPFELKYALESEYMAPPIVTTLVPVDAEVIRDPLLAS